MEFLLLGPIEVRDGDCSLPLGGAKRRALLALLALHANEVVSLERLSDELWGEDAPRNAAASIHNHVSRLRKELGADALLTRRGGYELCAERASVDAFRFEDVVASAPSLPPPERAARLAESLSWWRGDALADLAFEPSLSTHIARLTELRLLALEQRIGADLELGRAAELVPELEGLIEAQPLREHLRSQLILALYRSGRQADALEAYRETRRLLSDELGIEPGPELRELERAVLRQDPALGSMVRTELRPASPRVTRRRFLPFAIALGMAGAATGIYQFASSRGDASTPHDAVPAARSQAPGSTTTSRPVTRHATSGHATHQRPIRSTAPPITIARHRAAVATPKTTPKAATPVRAPAKTTTTVAPRRTGATPQPPRITTTVPSTTAATPPPPSLADPTTWLHGTNEADLQLVQSAGSVDVSIPATAMDGWSVFVQTRCRASGDFDARTHFTLSEWPGADGIWVSLAASDLGGVNAYRTDAFGESYGTYVPPSGGTSIHASGMGGWLRLARSASSITGSYSEDGQTWTTIYTGSGATDATALALGVFNLPSVASFAGMPARVAFDSFDLTAPTLDC
jgi:DNA-binding SARP family transcriptional activator